MHCNKLVLASSSSKACDPAPCGVKNATLQADKCICDDGFDGKVEWGGGKWIGVCQAVTEWLRLEALMHVLCCP